MAPKNTSGTSAGIRELLKKATTEMLVLFLLSQKPMYTYEMMSTVERISEGKITFNTLYQAIYRLQGFKYIEESEKILSDSNRIRIYFLITERGQKYLGELISEYNSTIDTINSVLALDGKVVGEDQDG